MLKANGQNSWQLKVTEEEFEESEEIADKVVRETSEQFEDTNRHYITRRVVEYPNQVKDLEYYNRYKSDCFIAY